MAARTERPQKKQENYLHRRKESYMASANNQQNLDHKVRKNPTTPFLLTGRRMADTPEDIKPSFQDNSGNVNQHQKINFHVGYR